MSSQATSARASRKDQPISMGEAVGRNEYSMVIPSSTSDHLEVVEKYNAHPEQTRALWSGINVMTGEVDRLAKEAEKFKGDVSRSPYERMVYCRKLHEKALDNAARVAVRADSEAYNVDKAVRLAKDALFDRHKDSVLAVEIRQAVKENGGVFEGMMSDELMVAAVAMAPEYLTGVKKKTRDRMIERWLEKDHPALVMRKKAADFTVKQMANYRDAIEGQRDNFYNKGYLDQLESQRVKKSFSFE